MFCVTTEHGILKAALHFGAKTNAFSSICVYTDTEICCLLGLWKSEMCCHVGSITLTVWHGTFMNTELMYRHQIGVLLECAYSNLFVTVILFLQSLLEL